MAEQSDVGINLVVFVLLYGTVAYLVLKWVRKKRPKRRRRKTGEAVIGRLWRWYTGRSSRNLQQRNPREFEQLVVRLYERLGYEVKLTQQSRDGGVDLYARRDHEGSQEALAVECKHYQASTVGVAPVRALYGVITSQPELTQGILVTSGVISAEARKFAAGKRIGLIDGAQLRSLLAKHGL